MLRKLLFIWIAVILALAPAGTVFAQSDAPAVFCGDLAEADCQLLTDTRDHGRPDCRRLQFLRGGHLRRPGRRAHR
ncbi:MAG: hypothetical protein R2838_12185 [Caldilineaceae bacterium]